MNRSWVAVSAVPLIYQNTSLPPIRNSAPTRQEGGEEDALLSHRLTSWNTDSSAAQLERVFGAGYNNLISHPTDPQTAMSTVQVLPGPQLEPLQPQPAPLPPPAPSHLKALPQPPIKKRTPSEVPSFRGSFSSARGLEHLAVGILAFTYFNQK
ncbi:hypothetical protein EGR_10177 [Echinococcus granulosus]|uniref:Uncharacterized protein n=1 Tax=Echinococcus granulosus TaxID=6210 RepID=W6UNP5_ECHGR|nr:hypothetical protein EGR_10177 [Echinococcus granulosus]EUB54969.1 hypothetical protein EGR_10177 [Echinococcus granulosus]